MSFFLHRTRASLVAGAASLAVSSLLLAGCSSADREELELGTCINGDISSGTLQGIDQVDCDSPHFGQVVGMLTVPGGPYPGTDTLTDEAEQPCKTALAEYAGIELSTSVLDLVPLLPSESAWEDGDRTVLCLVYHSLGEDLEGSVKARDGQSRDFEQSGN